jgi:hypothetical protein
MASFLGPVKPKKKPKPKKITLFDSEGNEVYGWLDCADTFSQGVEIFACTEEDMPIFDKGKGVYTDSSGSVVTIIDGIVDENRSTDAVRYKSENEADWFRRNFNYFFVSYDNDNIKTKSTYLQQFVTISNKPNIIAAEVDILNWNALNKSIVSILKQQASRDFQNVKVDNSLNVFDAIVKRNENESNESYANRIIETIKGKTNLPELLNTEKNIDANKLKSLSEKFSGGNVNELTNLFYANFFVNLHQLNQIVAGDEAFYKNSFDVVKRMSIAFATGYKGMVNDKFGLPKTYRSLVLKDIKGILGKDFNKFNILKDV